jgi:malonyl-CoA decarboxylase
MSGIFGAISRLLRSGDPKFDRDRFDDLSPGLPDSDAERVAAGLRACLLGKGGRMSTQRRCVSLGRAYMTLSPEGRRKFLRIIARDFAADGAATLAAVADLDEFNDWRGPLTGRGIAVEAMEPPRRRLLRTLGSLPGGDELLSRMRADLSELLGDDDAAAELATDLDGVLGSLR